MDVPSGFVSNWARNSNTPGISSVLPSRICDVTCALRAPSARNIPYLLPRSSVKPAMTSSQNSLRYERGFMSLVPVHPAMAAEPAVTEVHVSAPPFDRQVRCDPSIVPNLTECKPAGARLSGPGKRAKHVGSHRSERHE